MSGETVWDVQADEARYEADRVEREEPGRLDDGRPTRAELAGDRHPRHDSDRPHTPDPWQTDTLTAGDRVYHILNTDPDARAKGTGTITDRRRSDGWQVEYLVDYDNGGHGWHRSADVRKAGGDDAPPF